MSEINNNITIKAKLCAYTKGVLPVIDQDFLKDAPGSIALDGKIYARKNKQWVEVEQGGSGIDFEVPAEGGLNFDINPLTGKHSLTINQNVLSELPQQLDDNATYYILEQTPEFYVNGGTAYSNGNNEYVDEEEYRQIINGGQASTTQFTLELEPINSKGEYNGN